ncbi:transposase, partial [Flavilitoribacter nigricans DSM 23189 = NBRC 102662]
KKYSPHYQRSITKVVEEKSETQKRLALEQKIKELEQFIGRQQVQLSYYERLLATAEQRYNIELEKNSDWKSSNGFSHTDPNTK